MDERAGLPAGAMHGQGIVDRRLDQEPVQNRAVIAVIIEPVDQLFVPTRLFGMRAPDDALMQVRDPQPVVLRVELEQDLIQRFGHVIDAARTGGIEDLHPLLFALQVLDLDVQITLRDGGADAAIAIDAHGPQMHQMRVDAGLDQRGQQVMRRRDVVVDRIDLVVVRFHRIGRGALFGEMDDRIGAILGQPVAQAVVILCQIQQVKADALAADLFPDATALLDGIHRGQGLHAQFRVDPAPRQVVDDMDLMALIGQMQRRRPATKPVPTQYCDFHWTPQSDLLSGSS